MPSFLSSWMEKGRILNLGLVLFWGRNVEGEKKRMVPWQRAQFITITPC